MVWLSFMLASATLVPKPFSVQFAQSVSGRNVTICLDGQFVETAFAGKLGFRDATHEWTSVCADVRGPVRAGQVYAVRLLGTSSFGGRVARAGNIVARYFYEAQSPDQCAGLQIAVWKALEDSADRADFSSGHLQVRSTFSVMSWAQQYYQAINTPGDAVYLQTANGGGQGAGFGTNSGVAGSGGQGPGGGTDGGGQSQLTNR